MLDHCAFVIFHDTDQLQIETTSKGKKKKPKKPVLPISYLKCRGKKIKLAIFWQTKEGD